MKALLKELGSKAREHAVLCVLILTVAGLASGQSAKLSPDLQALPGGAAVNVIVQYHNPPSSGELNSASAVGAAKGKALGLVNAYRWTMSPGNVQQLLGRDANVKYVSVDRPLKGAMNLAVPTVNADLAQNLGYDGTGVGVAVIDSGINPIADLTGIPSKTSRIVYSQNF